jgi:hypothetical protein
MVHFDVNSVLGLLHRVDVDDYADVSEVSAASILRIGRRLEDGGSRYFCNVGIIVHIHTM